VALNIAMTLARFGITPTVVSAIGKDPAGNELLTELTRMGIRSDHVYRSDDLPTDVYMAIEGANGLIAAVADAHSLEAAGEKILTPIRNGSLSITDRPVALDGNLTVELLQTIASDPVFANADLRVAPASPGKAERLLAFMGHSSSTLYVNLEEAGLLCQTTFTNSAEAANALIQRGAFRALVTDGDRSASEATQESVITLSPPSVLVTRVTGAGDTFMAAHIVSELQGLDRKVALKRALDAAATYVSGETPL
jgi:sugar/nucleoside kinase (ribokinase family)